MVIATEEYFADKSIQRGAAVMMLQISGKTFHTLDEAGFYAISM